MDNTVQGEEKSNTMAAEHGSNELASDNASSKNRYEQFVEKHGWSGSTLKLIAIVTMFIDHLGAGILENYAVQHPEGGLFGMTYQQIFDLDYVMRGIGRIAFPIFCYTLVEGFMKTRNVWKYLVRLILFGLISEVPFDLCFNRTFWDPGSQNVYFTLALGLMTLITVRGIDNMQLNIQSEGLKRFLKVMLNLLAVAFFGTMALLLHTDYVILGIITIYLLYLGRKSRIGTLTAHAASCLILEEIPALAGLIPLALYNGKRGLRMKYFFYAFYPGHILLIWILSKYLGIA